MVLDELVEQVELLREVGLHLEQRVGAVFPASVYPVSSSVSSSARLEKSVSPDGVVPGVHLDDLLCEIEGSLRFLLLGDEGSEHVHRVAVCLFRARNQQENNAECIKKRREDLQYSW